MADFVVAREEGDGARTELTLRIPDTVWNDAIPMGKKVEVVEARWIPAPRAPQ